MNEQRRDDRRTAVDAEAEEYTSAEPGGDVESIVEARAPGHVRGTTDRHARRTLVRRALIVADVWSLGFTFAIVHIILGTSAKQGFTSGKELILFLLSVPCWLALAGLYGLYEGDRLRADTTTLDDFWPLFHAVTVGRVAGVRGQPPDQPRARQRAAPDPVLVPCPGDPAPGPRDHACVHPLARGLPAAHADRRRGPGRAGDRTQDPAKPQLRPRAGGLRRQRSAAPAPGAVRHTGAGHDRRSQRDRALLRHRARDAGLHRRRP